MDIVLEIGVPTLERTIPQSGEVDDEHRTPVQRMPIEQRMRPQQQTALGHDELSEVHPELLDDAAELNLRVRVRLHHLVQLVQPLVAGEGNPSIARRRVEVEHRIHRIQESRRRNRCTEDRRGRSRDEGPQTSHRTLRLSVGSGNFASPTEQERKLQIAGMIPPLPKPLVSERVAGSQSGRGRRLRQLVGRLEDLRVVEVFDRIPCRRQRSTRAFGERRSNLQQKGVVSDHRRRRTGSAARCDELGVADHRLDLDDLVVEGRTVHCRFDEQKVTRHQMLRQTPIPSGVGGIGIRRVHDDVRVACAECTVHLEAHEIVRLVPPGKFCVVSRFAADAGTQGKDRCRSVRVPEKDHLPKVFRPLVYAPIASSAKSCKCSHVTLLR